VAHRAEESGKNMTGKKTRLGLFSCQTYSCPVFYCVSHQADAVANIAEPFVDATLKYVEGYDKGAIYVEKNLRRRAGFWGWPGIY
jgi:hypothetical protein